MYTYRWWLAGMVTAAVFIMGFFYDLHAQWKTLQTLRTAEKQWASTVQDTQPRIATGQIKSSAVTLSSRVYDLTRLAQTHGVTTLSIEVPAVAAPPLIVHWSGQGHFQQLVHFMLALLNDSAAISVVSFSFKTVGHTTLQVTLQLAITNRVTQSNVVPEEAMIVDPFCSTTAPDYVMQKNTFATLQTTPLEQLSLVGYMQQGKQQTAFLLLPDNTTTSVKIGEMLGKEQGRVAAITAQQLTVNLPNGKSIIIKRV